MAKSIVKPISKLRFWIGHRRDQKSAVGMSSTTYGPAFPEAGYCRRVKVGLPSLSLSSARRVILQEPFGLLRAQGRTIFANLGTLET